MKDAVVLFRTRQGFSARYAQWIGQELHCSVHEIAHTEPQHTGYARALVFGGGVYMDRIEGLPFLERDLGHHVGKKVVVFAVGLSDPNDEEAMARIIEKNHLADMKTMIKFFYFRGGIDFSKLKRSDRLLIKILHFRAKRKVPEKRTEFERLIVDHFNGQIDLSNRETIRELVKYVEAPGRG